MTILLLSYCMLSHSEEWSASTTCMLNGRIWWVDNSPFIFACPPFIHFMFDKIQDELPDIRWPKHLILCTEQFAP